MSCAQDKREAIYSSAKPALSFEWAVPAGWVHEEFGSPPLGFSGVTFLEKKQTPDAATASFSVTAKKAAPVKGVLPTLDAMADDAAQKSLKLPDARIVKRGTMKVAGQEARTIEVAYRGLTKIYTPGSKAVSLRQRIVIIPRGGMFYVIRYINDEKKFPALEPVFQRALKTFRFLNPA